MMKHAIALLILATLGLFAPRAHAQSCSLTSGNGTLIDFAAYTSVSGNVDAQGSITMNCTPVAPLFLPVGYSVSIGKGSSSNWSPRTLLNGGYALNYNLYTDVTRLILFGDGSLGSSTSKKSGTCSGSCSVFVYGRLVGGSSVPAGLYSDQVQVTLDF